MHTQTAKSKIDLPREGQFDLGRGTRGLGIKHPEVSRRHLVLNMKNGGLAICDTSANGTWIDGKKVPPGDTVLIKNNCKISLTKDDSVFIDVLIGQTSAKHVPPAGTLQSMLSDKSTVTIGRDNSCDIVVDDMSVSRKHATVKKLENRYMVFDHSLNGTYINGKKIGSKSELREGDVLIVGLRRFSLAGTSKNLVNEPVIQSEGVTYTFPGGNIGLQKTSFTVREKSMVALMGPSGCGKSTLLNVLNGYRPPSSGVVKIFGLDLNDNFDVIKQYIGYVPQSDIVHEHLTVLQALEYTAKLRLGKGVADDEVQERIQDVLRALKIDSPDIYNNLIRNLSGGQKKRVCIAVELLTKPKILFLDEPTGPLDPETIEEFLKSLKKLCDEGTTIIMVTHKPGDLPAMDEVIFMAPGGRFIFKGTEREIYSYFEEKSINSIYKKADDPVEGEKLFAKWNTRQKGDATQTKKYTTQRKTSRVNPVNQLYWLITRYLRLKWNNRRNLIIAFVQPVFIALLILLVFPSVMETHEGLKTGNIGVLFIVALSIIWFGISNSAKEIVAERDIYRRERAFNLLPAPYYLSKTFVLGLLTAGQTAVFLAILFTGFEDMNHLLNSFLFLIILGLASVSFGLLLSAFGKSTEAVMTVLPVALIPQIVLAGIIQPVESTLTQFFSYLTLGRWGTEGLARIQDSGLSQEPFPFVTGIENNLYPVDAAEFSASLTANVWMLLFLLGIFSLITFIKISKKQVH